MKLFDQDNSVELTILGLHRSPDEMQAKVKDILSVDPGMRLEDDESPWVDVRVEARTAPGAWNAEKDVLELHDVPFIAAWFRALASEGEARRFPDLTLLWIGLM